MRHLRSFFFLSTLAILAISSNAAAQTREQDAGNAALTADSLFWNGYNSCDLDLQSSLIAEDIEFYHDNGGITKGKKDMIESIRKNLCGEDFRLRREALIPTVKLHLLKSADTTYGVLITGEHQFYLIPSGKNERLDGHASFANLWLLTGNQWKLSRVFSYDHSPAKYINNRKEAKLSPAQLHKFAGTYQGKQSGAIVVKAQQNHLLVQIGPKSFPIYPESQSIFFMKERDLTFSFEKSPGSDLKLLIREFGELAEEAIKATKD